MTIRPGIQQTTSPNNQQRLHIASVLFGIAVVHLAQGFFQKAGWMAFQSSGVLSSDHGVLLSSAFTILKATVSVVCLILWGVLSDRFGPRSIWISGILLWALGTYAMGWSDSPGFLFVTTAVQTAGIVALLPAAFSAVTKAHPEAHGPLIGLLCAFHGSLPMIASLYPPEQDWKATLQLAPIVAVLPVLLGWFVLPHSPAEVAITRPARPHRSSGKLPALAQTLLFGAVLYGIWFYLSSFTLNSGGHISELARLRMELIDIPFMLGLAAGFIVGGAVSGKRDLTWFAWLITLTGAVISLTQPSFPSAPIAFGLALVTAGVGFGLPGQLIALLRPAPRNRPGLFSGLFQATQILGNNVGTGLPLLLVSLMHADPEITFKMFPACSLTLLVAGLVLAVVFRNRVTPGVEAP